LIILCAMPLSGAQGYAQVKFLKGFSQDAKVIYVKKKAFRLFLSLYKILKYLNS